MLFHGRQVVSRCAGRADRKTMAMASISGPSGRRRDAIDGAGNGGGGPGVPVPLIDADAIERLRQLDPTGQQGVLVRVLRAYEASLNRHLGDVGEALAAADSDRLARAAHTLKSSSAAVGAITFSQRCAEIEMTVREGKRMPESTRVEAMIHEGRRVLRAVGDMLLSENGASS
jgi:HPt (histidine-containing phosphotransfer) domain-containing protein